MEEGWQILELARVSCQSYKAEKAFIELKLQESLMMVQFYEWQVDQAEKCLETAEAWVGQVYARLRKGGLPIEHAMFYKFEVHFPYSTF